MLVMTDLHIDLLRAIKRKKGIDKCDLCERVRKSSFDEDESPMISVNAILCAIDILVLYGMVMMVNKGPSMLVVRTRKGQAALNSWPGRMEPWSKMSTRAIQVAGGLAMLSSCATVRELPPEPLPVRTVTPPGRIEYVVGQNGQGQFATCVENCPTITPKIRLSAQALRNTPETSKAPNTPPIAPGAKTSLMEGGTSGGAASTLEDSRVTVSQVALPKVDRLESSAEIKMLLDFHQNEFLGDAQVFLGNKERVQYNTASSDKLGVGSNSEPKPTVQVNLNVALLEGLTKVGQQTMLMEVPRIALWPTRIANENIVAKAIKRSQSALQPASFEQVGLTLKTEPFLKISTKLNTERLYSVYFTWAGAKVGSVGDSMIERAAKDYQSKSQMITLVGKADPTGDSAINERLAAKRGEAVKEKLISKGVPDRFIAVVVDTSTGVQKGVEGTRVNPDSNWNKRRVDIVLHPGVAPVFSSFIPDATASTIEKSSKEISLKLSDEITVATPKT